MLKLRVLVLLLPFLFLVFSCEKDNSNLPPDDTNLEEEELLLTVWEYDMFNGNNLKTGAFWEYYVRGITGSAILFGQVDDESGDMLYEYQIIPENNRHHVYFSENGSDSNEKKFEYGMVDNKLGNILGFYNNNQITEFKFLYAGSNLVSIAKDDINIAFDIQYDSRGNITRLSKTNGTTLYYHFKICESKNPFKRIFKNFNIYNESLFSIISFLNPNFVLDVVANTSPEFDWNSCSIRYSAEANEDNLPEIIRERRYDTQGNMTMNKIIAEYEYH
jgi:hypothetical protein